PRDPQPRRSPPGSPPYPPPKRSEASPPREPALQPSHPETRHPTQLLTFLWTLLALRRLVWPRAPRRRGFLSQKSRSGRKNPPGGLTIAPAPLPTPASPNSVNP